MNSHPFNTRHFTLPALDTARTARTANERALVLGGGGSAGNAWLIGAIAGLLAAGLDVTDADVLIGTSAGATAAAQISGASPARLLADILAAEPPQRTAGGGTGSGRAPTESAAGHLRRTGELIAAAADPADMRRRMGAAALELEAASEASGQARWSDTVAARLPVRHWPERTMLLTAVDARTGEPVVFDRHSGVDLVDAVAASCAAATAYGIGEDWFIDGGYRRSSENADLAAGCGRVLVFSPLGGRTRHPAQWGMGLAVQVDELRAGGSGVETILPDDGSLDAFGNNMMDPSTRPAAARAGCEQGRALAGRLAGFWH
ncbi:patatin [Arthrobacter sp. UCD-GKA]|uniref:patatin-like phospholipase family protein n=1 Tax=Arthrobacter sp. UCD-GKA TaxID=1913576 RepID=UPI0008DDC8B0|nr:patatin-like phospholipase family protein [Arthrobacter sp. UCD-GKA]OIH85866.1 patatin [Arthrobacter sp. UCD-GKA]